MPSVKHGVKDFGQPCCLGKGGCFDLRHKTNFQYLRSVGMRRASAVLGFKDSHDIRRAMAIAVVNDEFGTAEDTDEASEPNQQPSFLEHFPDCGIRRGFGWLDGIADYCAKTTDVFSQGIKASTFVTKQRFAY